MNRLRVWLTAACLTLSTAALAQDTPSGEAAPPASTPSEGGEASPPSGEAAPPASEASTPSEDASPSAPTTPVTVRIQTAAGAPVTGEHDVRIHIVLGSHQLLGSVDGTTAADGTVVLDTPVVPGSQIVAEVAIQGALHFSEQTTLTDGEAATLVIPLTETTDDPSVLSVANLSTIADLWEGYITFTQVWRFQTDAHVIFSNMDGRDPQRDWLAIPMPDGAEGITVLQPRSARVIGETVYVALTVEPDLEEGRQPHLLVRYSLKRHDSDPTLSFRQPMRLPVRSATVVATESTDFRRHPLLDLTIDAPLCGYEGEGEMCFATVVDAAETGLIREGAHAESATGGRAEAGDTLVVSISGWPTRPPLTRYATVGFGLLGLLAGVWASTARRREDDPVAALHTQREALQRAWAELEQAYADARILERDYETAKSRLSEELGVIERRIREASEACRDSVSSSAKGS